MRFSLSDMLWFVTFLAIWIGITKWVFDGLYHTPESLCVLQGFVAAANGFYVASSVVIIAHLVLLMVADE